MTLYQFNKRVVKHFFCPTCGCAIFGTAANGKVVGINVRSVENLDLENMTVQFFEGKDM